ncbi:MAG TPA: hypothetical protein VK034_23730 [Enhygromyxa sp.]|nr:hypothetical protein [Enhygromyxa sp.]
MTGCVVLTDDGSDEAGDGDGDATTGDGDGDPTGDGDGDGEPGDGDGEPGDGDGEPGDGDGEPGDGDGDVPSSCGWDTRAEIPGYYCGFEGEDPAGVVPYDCPDGLVEGEACGTVTVEGCCDAEGDNWYCGTDNEGTQLLAKIDC